MAEKVVGIEVQIGGDTVGLNKALQSTNKEISSTQKELSQVEKLLKLDPKNTELLAQKQQLLSKAISETSTKLEALKSAKQKADETMKNGGEVNQEQYRKLQREIVATENNLKSLNNKAEESKVKFDALGKNAEKVNKIMAGAGVAVIGLGAGLANMAVQAGKSADDINTLSKQTGLSTEQIQKFKYASDIIDVSLDTLTGSMAKLTKNMATASKGTGDAYNAFNKLGIEIKNADGTLRNNQDVFNETIKVLGTIENETERDALAMQIFGKSAQELNPLILGGADALEELGKEAEEAGLILSQDALDSASAFNDSLDKLKATSSGAFSKVGTEIATALIPVMEKVSELVKWLLDNKDTIVVALSAISAGILAFNCVTMIQGIIKAFQAWQLATEGMTVAQALLNAVMSANPIGIVVMLIAGLVAGIVALWNTNEGFRNALISAWEAIKTTAVNVWNMIVDFFTVDIPNAFQTVITFVQEHWQDLLLLITNPIAGALKLLYELNPKFREWVDGLLAKIKEWFGGMKDIGKNIVEGLWQGILNTKDWLLNKIKSFAHTITDGIKDFFGIESPSKVMRDEVGKYMAQGIGVGFSKEIPNIITGMKEKMGILTESLSLEGLAVAGAPLNNPNFINQNSYVTKNYSNTTEVVRQPSTVVLEVDKRELGKVVVPAYDKEKNRLGVAIK